MDNNTDSFNVDEYSVFTVLRRVQELSHLTDNFAIITLPLCRNLLNKAFLSLNSPEYSKIIALASIEFCFSQIKPYTLLKAKDHREQDGTTLLSIVEYMLSFIRTHGPQELDVNFHEIIISSDPCAELYKSTCKNVIACLEEFRELLKRADGNQFTDLELQRLSPFLSTEYFSLAPRNISLRILRFFYPFKRVRVLSDYSATSLANITEEETKGGMQDSLLLQKYIDNANTSLESHKKELSCKIDCPGKITLRDKFMSIIIYLLRFIEITDVKNFDETEEFGGKILNNLKGFYYILITSSLTEVLNPENENMIEYFKDIIFATNEALRRESNCSSLENILKKLKNVAYQLWHMCLKQMSTHPFAAECKIFLDYQLRRVLQADVITEASLGHWKLKFASFTNKEEILAKCPYDECCICSVPFFEVDENSESSDIAVLPRCPHLFCITCLAKSLGASQSE